MFSKKNIFLFLFLLIILALLSGCNIFNTKNGALEGKVLGERVSDPIPIQGALISITGSTNTATTDQDGYFLLTDAPAGKRIVTIIKEGYVTLRLLNVFIEPEIVNQIYFGEPVIMQPKEDTILFNQAVAYFEDKEHPQALNSFKELLNTFPDSIWVDDAHYYIGNIYELNGLYISARDEYSLLLFYHPNSPWADDARLGIGNCYYQTGDYHNAKIQYQLVVDSYPNSNLIPLAQYRIAWCSRKSGNYDEAIHDFKQVIVLFPESIYAPPAQYFIAEVYYDLQYYDQAIRDFQTTINNYPIATWPGENRLIAPLAYFYIGYCNEKLEMWQEAVNSYQEIINNYPNSTWDNGKSISKDAQERIEYIRNNHLPPTVENPEEDSE